MLAIPGDRNQSILWKKWIDLLSNLDCGILMPLLPRDFNPGLPRAAGRGQRMLLDWIVATDGGYL